MNATAEYMASYSLQNLTHFVEAPTVFGNLKYFLDRDMGLALSMEIIPDFGRGEVLDDYAPPTESLFYLVDLEQKIRAEEYAIDLERQNVGRIEQQSGVTGSMKVIIDHALSASFFLRERSQSTELPESSVEAARRRLKGKEKVEDMGLSLNVGVINSINLTEGDKLVEFLK